MGAWQLALLAKESTVDPLQSRRAAHGDVRVMEHSPTVSTRVFISYRRNDAAAEAASIASQLRAWFGETAIFFDTSSIEAGAQWPDAIERALEATRVVLALIGPDWLRAGADESTPAGRCSVCEQPRFDSESDWVRRELAYSLGSENKVVIPVLLRGAKMPPASVLSADLAMLSSCNALSLAAYDVDTCLLLRDAVSEHVPLGGTGDLGQMKFERASPEAIDNALATDLRLWRLVTGPECGKPDGSAKCLMRDLQFPSYTEAARFMIRVAPQFEISSHHPTWEHVWRTLTVRLSTWDLGWDISLSDLTLARYLESKFTAVRTHYSLQQTQRVRAAERDANSR